MITRDPVQRVWSDYNYAIQHKQIPTQSLKDALDNYPRFLAGCNYKKWIKHWKKTKPTVYSLEEMDINFINNQNIYKPNISLDIFKYISARLEKEKHENYFRNDMDLTLYYKKDAGTTGAYDRIR